MPSSYRPRLRLPLALLSLLALLLAGCGQTSYSVDEHIERAQSFHADGDLRAAVIEIKNALQREPSRADARRLLGLYNLETGDYAAAANELNRALELDADPALVRLPLARARLQLGEIEPVLAATDPIEAFPEEQRPAALALRGEALLAQGELLAASEVLLAALEREPERTNALLGMAWVELLTDRPEEARQRLDQALASDPGFDRAWELLGDLERTAGQAEAAETAYGKAIEATRKPFSPRYKRALTRIDLADFDGAERDIQALRQGYGDHAAISYARGLLAFHQQRHAEARTDFEDALSRNAEHGLAIFYLGATHYALGNWRQAENQLSRTVVRFPDFAPARRLLALIRLQEGDPERAEQSLASILERHPDDTATLALLGNLYLNLGRTDDALQHMRHVATLQPESAVARARLAMALVQQGQREEGLQELETAIALDTPERMQLELALVLEHLRAGEFRQALGAAERLRRRGDIDPALAHNLIGLAHIGLRDPDAAEAAFREGLERAPESADLASNLAGLLQLRERADEARQILRDALEQHPEHLGLLTRLARLLAVADDPDSALELLLRAIAANPEALDPRLAAAQLLITARRFDDAAELLEPALAAHGDDVRVIGLAAESARGRGRFGEAAAWYRDAARLAPDHRGLQVGLAQSLWHDGDRDGALAAFEEWLEHHPDDHRMQLDLANGHLVMEHEAAAIEAYEQVLREAPDTVVALNNLAWLLREMDTARALTLAERATALAPDQALILDTLGMIQLQAGENAFALENLRRAAGLAPDNPMFRLHFARALKASDRRDEAAEELEALVAQHPDTAEAGEARALLREL